MRKLAVLALVLWPALALAQSSPGFVDRTVLTAPDLNAAFQTKADATNGILVNPNLGTPSAVILTNGTGLPVATGISGLGTGVATALGNAAGASGGFALANGVHTLSKSAGYTLLSSDLVNGTAEVRVDTSAGNVTITIPYALGTASNIVRVRVVKTTTDSNQVIISGDSVGHTPYAYIISPNDAAGGGYLDAEVDGTTIHVFGNP